MRRRARRLSCLQRLTRIKIWFYLLSMHTSASPRVKNKSTNHIQIALTSREATEPSHSGLRRDGADQPVKAVRADAAHREVLRQGRRWRMGGTPPQTGCNPGATNQMFCLFRNSIRFIVVPTSICNVHTLRVLRRRRLPQEAKQSNWVSELCPST